MTKASNNTTNNTKINQNQLVIGFLRRNSRRNLTSEQICEGVNEIIAGMAKGKSKKPSVTLTTTQVSKCLNRFSEREMVKKIDVKGRLSNGRKCLRWGYVKP